MSIGLNNYLIIVLNIMEPLRKKKLQYIKDNIDFLQDKYIDSIYEKLCINIPNKIKTKDLKRVDKMKHIEINLKYLEDDMMETINQIIIKNLVYEETVEEKKKRIVLDLINKILTIIGHTEIHDLEDFIDIRRDDILSDKVKNIIDENRDYIFETNGFDKAGCMIYQKNLKNPHFSIIKGILNEVGFEMIAKSKADYINKKKIAYRDYYIKKIEK
jgi:hypothetical protein